MWSVPHPHAHLGHTLMFCHLKSFYITSPWQTASSLPISKMHLRETHPPVAPHLLLHLSQLNPAPPTIMPGGSCSFQSLSPSRGLWMPLWLQSCVPCLPSSFTLLPHQRSPVLSGSSDPVFLLYRARCPPSPSLNSSSFPGGSNYMLHHAAQQSPKPLPHESPDRWQQGQVSQRHPEGKSSLGLCCFSLSSRTVGLQVPVTPLHMAHTLSAACLTPEHFSHEPTPLPPAPPPEGDPGENT